MNLLQQTTIVVRQIEIIAERPRASNLRQIEGLVQESSLEEQVKELKAKVEDLTRRVRQLEQAAIETVDLTGDDSFNTTVSVHSEDMSPVENGF